MQVLKTENHIYENLRKFEVELTFTTDGNLANIKEAGKNVWTIYSHTEKGLKIAVKKWVKSNW